jgi:rod shape-determining protein MreB and related proteins
LLHLSQDIGIDLGTSNVLVHVRGKGIVLREPCVVAIDLAKHSVLSIGHAARDMVGRTPANIAIIQPIVDGVIANSTVAIQMLEHIFQKVCGANRVFKPHVLLAVPSGATSVQTRAIRHSALTAGAGRAETIEEPMAAAIGAGLPISTPGGNMVVDVGGGTTDIAVISLDGIVISRSLTVGGIKFDDTIARHVKSRYNVSIGDRTAEEVKMTIGSATPLASETSHEIGGRDLVTGLPRNVTLTSTEVREALSDSLAQITQRIKSVLEKTPPELASDIMERGITLTGGGALLRNFDRLIAHVTHVPTHLAKDPLSCVVLGVGRALAERRGISE